jgi:hypothetical protein
MFKDSIMSDKLFPVCCCLAEDNQRFYLDRIHYWAGQLATEPYELHVFVDGKVREDVSVLRKIGVVFHEQDHIGRDSCWVFQSYKRSFREMCKMFPDGFAVVENDVLLTPKGKQALREYSQRQGLFCGWTKKYGFIETAVMVLTDPDTIKRYAEHYTDKAIYENEVFEKTLDKLALSSWQSVFIGEREEGHPRPLAENQDYISQYFGC